MKRIKYVSLIMIALVFALYPIIYGQSTISNENLILVMLKPNTIKYTTDTDYSIGIGIWISPSLPFSGVSGSHRPDMSPL